MVLIVDVYVLLLFLVYLFVDVCVRFFSIHNYSGLKMKLDEALCSMNEGFSLINSCEKSSREMELNIILNGNFSWFAIIRCIFSLFFTYFVLCWCRCWCVVLCVSICWYVCVICCVLLYTVCIWCLNGGTTSSYCVACCILKCIVLISFLHPRFRLLMNPNKYWNCIYRKNVFFLSIVNADWGSFFKISFHLMTKMRPHRLIFLPTVTKSMKEQRFFKNHNGKFQNIVAPINYIHNVSFIYNTYKSDYNIHIETLWKPINFSYWSIECCRRSIRNVLEETHQKRMSERMVKTDYRHRGRQPNSSYRNRSI